VRRFRSVRPAEVPERLAHLLTRLDVPGAALRVAVDGPEVAAPVALAEALVPPLRLSGRVPDVIDARLFWHNASVRLEHGREDVESYPRWLDDGALRREVLDPLGPGGSGRYLPSLRDPETNRSTRAARVTAGPGTVVIVAGELLLGRGLPFDVTIHLAVSASARRRRTARDAAWTLPAFERYDAEVGPVTAADVVLRLDDPRHPAIG
jgi:hypothetical protein